MYYRDGTSTEWIIITHESLWLIGIGISITFTLLDNKRVCKFQGKVYWYIIWITYIYFAASFIKLLAILEEAIGVIEGSNLCLRSSCAGNTDFLFIYT
jgi:hypothetical protein